VFCLPTQGSHGEGLPRQESSRHLRGREEAAHGPGAEAQPGPREGEGEVTQGGGPHHGERSPAGHDSDCHGRPDECSPNGTATCVPERRKPLHAASFGTAGRSAVRREPHERSSNAHEQGIRRAACVRSVLPLWKSFCTRRPGRDDDSECSCQRAAANSSTPDQRPYAHYGHDDQQGVLGGFA
jgi:hypothetical protein